MAIEDESRPELTLPSTSNRQVSSGTYPLDEIVTHHGSTPAQHTDISPFDDGSHGTEPLHEIEDPRDETRQRRPRSLSYTTSRALPFALSALVVYIYYVYVVLVCIDYLLHVKHKILQTCFYIVVFTILILLFFVSYALSIFCAPGSPSKASLYPSLHSRVEHEHCLHFGYRSRLSLLLQPPIRYNVRLQSQPP
ncbi:hypothetical protein B0O80DRAFT_204041 [Mortierella sp. GBAus27b]|nr:hypothetical protein B0O80DRAFT_204041 [Mortierella sp. GBAus27b]